MPILLKLFQKLEREHFQIHFIKPALPYCQRQKKTAFKKKGKKQLQAKIPDEYRCTNSQQNTSKPSSQHIKRIIHHNQVKFNM